MKDAFGEIARDYDKTITLINSLDDWVFIKNLPRIRQRVLDIGCGSGYLLALMSKYFNFDYIVSHTTFHHLDRKKAIEEAKRVLKGGGKLVIVEMFIVANFLRPN